MLTITVLVVGAQDLASRSTLDLHRVTVASTTIVVMAVATITAMQIEAIQTLRLAANPTFRLQAMVAQPMDTRHRVMDIPFPAMALADRAADTKVN